MSICAHSFDERPQYQNIVRPQEQPEDIYMVHKLPLIHTDPHSQLLLVPLVLMDNGHGSDLLGLLGLRAGQVCREPLGPAVVDDLDDLHVAGEHLGHDLDGPLLESLGHDRVVGVVEHLQHR